MPVVGVRGRDYGPGQDERGDRGGLGTSKWL